MNRILATLSLAAFAITAPAQTSDLLDVFEAKVKPEKRADFDAIARKVAEANRKAKGDNWITVQNEYGEGNTVYFISTRQNHAAIEQGFKAFMGAINEAYGPGGARKFEQDFNTTVSSTRAELRRRRWDLSANVPSEPAGLAKLIGEGRWLRTTMVRVRQGHQSDFEEAAKAAKAAFEKGSPSWTVLVSQTIAGAPGVNYYLTSVQPTLAAFDTAPSLSKLMGDEDFAKWQKGNAEHILVTETRYMRFLPELSNAIDEIAKVSPEFWRPKMAAARAKSKPAESAKPAP